MNKRGDIVTTIYFIIGFVLILSVTVIFLFSQVSITGMVSYETGETQVSSASFLPIIIVLAVAVFFLLFAVRRAAKKQVKKSKKKK
jgi:hypothetical protein